MTYFQVNEKCNGCLACVQNCPARALESHEQDGVQILRHNMARCARCATWSCATCDFAFPGDIHLCPRCATEPPATLSPRRKQLVIWSYVLAGFATLVLGLLMAGALGRPGDGHTDAQALGLVYSVFIFLPALVGLGLSFSARERRLPNPPVLWGTLIWNVALCSLLTLLSIVGILRK